MELYSYFPRLARAPSTSDCSAIGSGKKADRSSLDEFVMVYSCSRVFRYAKNLINILS